jgi:micrococcal nuclease
MVDSFRLNDSDSGSSTTQVQSSDRSREDNNGSGNCDRISYPDPDICSPPYPPDLNCPDISYKNFRVTGADPHGFDRDKDGIGCESAGGGGVTPPDNGNETPPDNGDGNCDPSYPDVCIKSPPPDLNCPDIPNKNFKVIGSDPHGFDRDNDGIGCESAVGVEDASSTTPSPTPTPQLKPPLTLTPTPPTDHCYLPGVGDWWDNPDCKDYLEDKYKTIAPSPPSLSPPCPPDAEGNVVCPPSDELTPVPPTDGTTPVPEPPPPECPDAGPEACGEEPPPEEVPPDSDDDTNGNGNNDGGSSDNEGDSSGGGSLFE